jgi:hypothetical protein
VSIYRLKNVNSAAVSACPVIAKFVDFFTFVPNKISLFKSGRHGNGTDENDARSDENIFDNNDVLLLPSCPTIISLLIKNNKTKT